MDTVDLAYTEFGLPNAQPLIVLHGFFASSRNWRQIAEKLSADYHVYTVDLRNHGVSPHHPVMNYPAMTADVLRFIKQRGLKTVNLLGHSMGGKVAMWFALNYPDVINNLIIADIAPVSYGHSFDNTILALKSLPLDEIGNRKQAEEWLAGAIPELSYRQFLLQNLVLTGGKYHWRVDLDIFYRMAPNIVSFPDAGHLAPFTRKALFLAGENSDFVNTESIESLFPGAMFYTIAEAGHWLHVQQPEMFTDYVGNFLQLAR